MWPNSSDSIRSLGSAAQLILIHGPVAPRAALVQRVGDQLLAGAALADDQHVGVGVGHRGDRLHHPLDAGRRAEDLAVGGLLDQPAAQLGVLDHELAVLERVLHEPEHLVGLERLLDDVEGAGALGRLHGLADRAVGGDHDDLEGGIAGLELAGERQAVAVGQHRGRRWPRGRRPAPPRPARSAPSRRCARSSPRPPASAAGRRRSRPRRRRRGPCASCARSVATFGRLAVRPAAEP